MKKLHRLFFLTATGTLFALLGACTTPLPLDTPIVAPVPAGADAAAFHADRGALDEDTPAPAPVAPARPLESTVLEAVMLALENNRALRVERLNPPLSRTVESIERAVFDPVLTADVGAARERIETDAGAARHMRTTSVGAGAAVSLPTGTLVAAEAATERASGSGLAEQYATRAGVTVTQALLRGFGLGPNLADLRQAHIDTQFSEYELRAFAEALVAEVETTYWDYVLARRQVEIFQESLQLAEKQLQETEVRIRVGDVAETERAAAQAEVALRREGLINARSRVATLQVQLLRLIAPDRLAAQGREVIAVTKPVVPENGIDALEEHVALALRLRPEVNQAQLLVRRGDLEIVKTKNGLLPRMDLFITLGRTGYANSFGRSAGDVVDDGYDVGGGLTLEFPVGNRAARARHQAARLSRQQLVESMRNIEDLVREDVELAYIEVVRARQQVDATAATRRFQEEKLRAETAKFNADKSTALLVAGAQRDLVVSQVAEVEAVTNSLKALTIFYLFDGSLLERRGIHAPGGIPAGVAGAEGSGMSDP